MTNANEIPYGALYSFQPDYLMNLLHDVIIHEDLDEKPVSQVCSWTAISRQLKFFFRHS